MLVLVVIAALLGGMFSKASQGLVAVMVAFGYFIAAFALFEKEDPLWFVTLMMGFALSAVLAMVGAFAGRVLSKLLPPRN